MTVEMHHFTARDGTTLAWSELTREAAGAGRPVILLHGLFSNAATNWVRFGHAATIAAAGFRVIMPDLRAHGLSAAPHDPAAYPPEVLVRDLIDLIDHLGLEDFDLGGFSLGARTVTRAVIGGVEPRRLVLAGMGLEGLAGWSGRREFFVNAIDRFAVSQRGDADWMAIQFMKTMQVDLVAARLLLGSFADTAPAALGALAMPVLVVCGADDDDNGSADRLAAALPDATRVTIPGTHMSSVAEPALGQAIAAFLSA